MRRKARSESARGPQGGVAELFQLGCDVDRGVPGDPPCTAPPDAHSPEVHRITVPQHGGRRRGPRTRARPIGDAILPWTHRDSPGPDTIPGGTVTAWPGRVDPVDELDGARYISLTTFKRDGSPVSGPVWITGTGGTYVFTTGDKAWKTRRLMRNASVRVQVCDMRGHVQPSATSFEGTGEVADSPDAVAAAEQALAAKYGWQFHAIKLVDALEEPILPGRAPGACRHPPVAAQGLTVPTAAGDATHRRLARWTAWAALDARPAPVDPPRSDDGERSSLRGA